MAGSPAPQNDWLSVRLTTLEFQLQELEAALSQHRQTEARARQLERDLRELIEQAKPIVDRAEHRDPPHDSSVELAQRLREWKLLETRLLETSARRIHEFERRLQHEWEALRQLHETPIKALEQRAAQAQEALGRIESRFQTLDSEIRQVVADATREIREAATLMHEPARQSADGSSAARSAGPDAASSEETARLPWRVEWVVLLVLVLGAGFIYTSWRLGAAVRGAETRAVTAEQQAVRAQQTAERQTRALESTTERQIAEVLASARRAERLGWVLSAPDLRHFPLMGQRTAPTASGQAVWSRSRGLVVTASSLPPPPSNQVHQAWLVTTRGTMSLGSVASDSLGSVTASFDIAPDLPGTVLGFMLTLEPQGGSARPLGPVVLAS